MKEEIWNELHLYLIRIEIGVFKNFKECARSPCNGNHFSSVACVLCGLHSTHCYCVSMEHDCVSSLFLSILGGGRYELRLDKREFPSKAGTV